MKRCAWLMKLWKWLLIFLLTLLRIPKITSTKNLRDSAGQVPEDVRKRKGEVVLCQGGLENLINIYILGIISFDI